MMNKQAYEHAVGMVLQKTAKDSIIHQVPVVYDKYDWEPITDNQVSAYNKFRATKAVLDVITRIKNSKKTLTPRAIYVPRHMDNAVAVLMDSEEDPEHGKAFLYSGGKYIKEGPQDIVL